MQPWQLTPWPELDMVFRLLMATAMGGIIGYERDRPHSVRHAAFSQASRSLNSRGQSGSGRTPPKRGSYAVLSLGSSTSRSASPSMLKPKTARLMAIPGKMAIQGAVSA